MSSPSLPLLVRVGLRRTGPWEPPTVLDRLLESPVRTVAYYLWRLATALSAVSSSLVSLSSYLSLSLSPSSLPEVPPVRVVCISDTHDQIVSAVPPGDLLIHAGDLTNAGTPDDLQKQIDWIAAQPHRHKIIIAGNHDTWLDPASRAAVGMPSEPGPVFPPSVHYLVHDTIDLYFEGGRKLTIYGAPDIPACGPDSFAFQYDPESPPWKDVIPSGIDILITHAPPRHHRDLGIGCPGLLREVWRVRPLLHVFGHVHWGAGREIVHWDASQQAYEALMEDDGNQSWTTRACLLPEKLGQMVVLFAASILSAVTPTAPGRGRSTVLINAAQMYGSTGRLGHNEQVIDI